MKGRATMAAAKKRLTVGAGLALVLLVVTAVPASAQSAPGTTTIDAAGNAITITALSHASVQVEYRGTIVQVDPARGDIQRARPADLILVTDIHDDHLNAGRVRRLRKDGGAVLMPAAAVAQVGDQLAFPVQTIGNGERRTVGVVGVEAVAAYNIVHMNGSTPFHTRGRGNAYVLSVGGKRLFFAGDTECVPEIKALTSIDVAFLPMNLPFTMSPAEAAECAKALKPGVAIPYHYQGADPRAFVTALQGSDIDVRMLDWYPAIERPDRVAMAMPGRLVDVGSGRRVHLYCSGSGGPTVLLQGAAFAIDWHFVQPEIARTRRVCTLDPAGTGWSDPGGEPETVDAAVADLHRALIAAGERPPFVLVGATGVGSVHARWLQIKSPAEVVGLVLIDGLAEESATLPVNGAPAPLWSLTSEQVRNAVRAFFPQGAPPPRRPPPAPQEDEPFDRLPADVLTTRVTFQMRRDAAQSQRDADAYIAMFDADRIVVATLHAAKERSAAPLGDVPIILLRPENDADAPFREGQAGLVRLTTNGAERIVKRAGSEIYLYDPAAVVLAVDDVARAAATKEPVAVR